MQTIDLYSKLILVIPSRSNQMYTDIMNHSGQCDRTFKVNGQGQSEY